MRKALPIQRIMRGLLILCALGVSASSSATLLQDHPESALLRSWLPAQAGTPPLIFSFEPGQETDGDASPAETLHKAVDHLSSSLVILSGRMDGSDNAFVIGGYNPRPWKTFLGFYEKQAGLYVFNLDSKQRWFYSNRRSGKHRPSPDAYGLSFANNALVIDPSLTSGSSDFSSLEPSEGSETNPSHPTVFTIDRLEIYEVPRSRDQGPASGTFEREKRTIVVPDSPIALLGILTLAGLVGVHFATRRDS